VSAGRTRGDRSLNSCFAKFRTEESLTSAFLPPLASLFLQRSSRRAGCSPLEILQSGQPGGHVGGTGVTSPPRIGSQADPSDCTWRGSSQYLNGSVVSCKLCSALNIRSSTPCRRSSSQNKGRALRMRSTLIAQLPPSLRAPISFAHADLRYSQAGGGT